MYAEVYQGNKKYVLTCFCSKVSHPPACHYIVPSPLLSTTAIPHKLHWTYKGKDIPQKSG